MGFNKIPCPGIYLEHKNKRPKLFVQYVQGFIEHNFEGMKAVGVETINDQVFILAMPDYSKKKPIVTFSTVKGKKTKKVEFVPVWKQPIESYLDESDFEYLKSRGKDRYGNDKAEKR